LGYIFSSSRWTNKISNSVVENYIDDKADINFLILKYKYFSVMQYDSYIKSFYKLHFSNKYSYLIYTRLLKYFLITFFSIFSILLVIQIIFFFTSQFLNLTSLSQVSFFLWVFISTPFFYLTKNIFYILPIYSYLFSLNYFNSELFKTSKVVLIDKPDSYSNDYNNNYLDLISKLLCTVNSLDEHSSKVYLLKHNMKNLFYLNLIESKIRIYNTYLICNTVDWSTEVLHNCVEAGNLIKSKPLAVGMQSDMLILNNITNNNIWKNNRWLYKFSLLNTHVTDVFFKLAEQKLLITQKPLNEEPFNFNLWFKNTKNVVNYQNSNLNIFNSTLTMFTTSRANLNFILNNSNHDTLHSLTFIEDSLSFLYKRFYTFDSIYSNVYLKTPSKATNLKLEKNTFNFDLISMYQFKSVNFNITTSGQSTNGINNYSINLNNDSNLSYYIILFNNSFNYNISSTNSCIMNFKFINY